MTMKNSEKQRMKDLEDSCNKLAAERAQALEDRSQLYGRLDEANKLVTELRHENDRLTLAVKTYGRMVAQQADMVTTFVSPAMQPQSGRGDLLGMLLARDMTGNRSNFLDPARPGADITAFNKWSPR